MWPHIRVTDQTLTATDGEFCATTPNGPDFDTIFFILPFSREQLGSTQGLSISPSTPPTNRIEVREHHGLLYQQIQKGDDTYKIQLVVPKTLIQQTVQHDVWSFDENCESYGVESKECAVINPTKKPPHHPPHPHSSALTSSTKETSKPERRKCQGGWRTSMAGCNINGATYPRTPRLVSDPTSL
ncbi:hypothetical protein H4Q32_000160 [Labeo rohita]|uniref:Uncharacterized protein n=1 Tax=Labeo rohita TaxID=84645 RepID=A0ABQ8LJ45_LABRO|nr:hypothetical protein H4Q32_000160 [Labeo rohita]